jgi:hypothetical protein
MGAFVSITNIAQCHNPSFGLATKTMAYKVVGQEGSPGKKESVNE